MRELRSLFRPLSTPLPDESQCDKCKYFDINHPEVIQIIKENYPITYDSVLYQSKCRCDDRYSAEAIKTRELWANSNIPNRAYTDKVKTFMNFKQVEGTEESLEKCRTFTRRSGSRILSLVGTYGSGKSHLLEAVAREWIHDGYSVRYEYVPSLLNELRSTQTSEEGNGSLWSKLQERFKASLLILDDLGQENPTEWTRKTLTEIVDERVRSNGWLLCATNYTEEQLRERVDERFVSRLFERGDYSIMTCGTYFGEEWKELVNNG